jgi:hypothetical protein
MPFVSRAQWPELVIGGVGSALSTALTVAWPLDVEVASASAGDAASREDPLALRRQAIAAGRDESDRQRWPWHLVNVGVGAAYFAILGFGYGHWKNGVWAGMSALAIGEAQTLTQPMGATRFFPGVTW